MEPLKLALSAALVIALFSSISLAETTQVEIPEIEVELDQWYEPHGYTYHTRWGNRFYYEQAEKHKAENYYKLGTHLYYWELTSPSGEKKVLSEYLFDNHKATGSINVPRIYGQYGCSYTQPHDRQSFPTCSTKLYYSNHKIPAQTITVEESGEYTLELKHVKIDAATADENKIISWDTELQEHQQTTINYQHYAESSSTAQHWEKNIQQCTSTTQQQYEEEKTFETPTQIEYFYKRWVGSTWCNGFWCSSRTQLERRRRAHSPKGITHGSRAVQRSRQHGAGATHRGVCADGTGAHNRGNGRRLSSSCDRPQKGV